MILRSIFNFLSCCYDRSKTAWKECLFFFIFGLALSRLIKFNVSISDILAVSSSLCVTGITIFTFVKSHVCFGVKYGNNILVKHEKFYGNEIRFYIKNASLLPRCICRVILVIDNKYRLILKTFEGAHIMMPYSYELIALQYTESNPNINLLIHESKELKFIIETPESVFSVSNNSFISNKINLFDCISSTKEIILTEIKFWNKVISSNLNYGITLHSELGDNSYLMDKNGIIDGTFPWGGNALPREKVDDKEILTNTLMEVAKNANYPLSNVTISDLKNLKGQRLRA